VDKRIGTEPLGPRRRLLASAFVAVVALVTLASFSSGATGATTKTVKIAVSAPMTGAGAFSAPIAHGAKSFFDYTNERGGVNSHKFDVTVLDNQLTATGGALTVKQALASNPFALIIGGSVPFSAAAGVIKQDAPNIPTFVIANAAVIAASGVKTAYGVQPSFTRECYFFAKYTKQTLKQNRFTIVYQDDAVGQSTGKNCPNYAKRQGIANVTAIPASVSTTNFGPVAAQLKDADSRAVFVVSTAPVMVSVQKAAQAIGYKATWMTYSGNDLNYVNLASELAEGVLQTNALEPIGANTPEMKLFEKEIRARVGETGLTGVGGSGWTLAAIIARGVKDATAGGKELTQAGFLNAVNKLKKQQIGVSSSVTYASRDHTTLAQSVSLYKVTNGRFTVVARNLPLPAH
jgi:ABC-type branched-subunit amino acid transport system substrate-binding protein